MWLHKGSDGALLRCTNEKGFNVPLIDGFANFDGLFINEAGMYYSLRFSTNLLLDGPTEIISNEFSVGIGPAAQIALINDASDRAFMGGKAFTPQPRAEVQDAGGNVLVMDSSSAIRVSFYSNPPGGKLSPESGTTEFLRKGIVQFRGLSIDKAGVGYRLSYMLLKYDGAKLSETSVITHGEVFNPVDKIFYNNNIGGYIFRSKSCSMASLKDRILTWKLVHRIDCQSYSIH